jgi:hypothetical protein
VFRYRLSGWIQAEGCYVDLRVGAREAGGTIGVLRVPLATETNRSRARRLLDAYNHVAERVRAERLSEEQDSSILLPVSEGNTITAPDIILNQG